VNPLQHACLTTPARKGEEIPKKPASRSNGFNCDQLRRWRMA
jgi:hypothetical protein